MKQLLEDIRNVAIGAAGTVIGGLIYDSIKERKERKEPPEHQPKHLKDS